MEGQEDDMASPMPLTMTPASPAVWSCNTANSNGVFMCVAVFVHQLAV
jgi:hypothetical protein